jgi:uncharacterized protein YbjT (DUF2867 family)
VPCDTATGRAGITNGVFTGFGLRPDKGVQLIAAEDIGAFVALAFANPPAYLGRTIEIAGDELTEPQIAATLAKVIGRPVILRPPAMPEGSTPTHEQLAMFQFFNGSTRQISRRYARSIPDCSHSSSF